MITIAITILLMLLLLVLLSSLSFASSRWPRPAGLPHLLSYYYTTMPLFIMLYYLLLSIIYCYDSIVIAISILRSNFGCT